MPDTSAWTPVQESAWKPVPQQAPAATPPSFMDSVGRSMKTMWDEVNPVEQLKGAANATSHPVDTLMNVLTNGGLAGKAEQSFKKGNYTEGLAHALYSLIPVIGPGLDRAGEMAAQGDVAGSLGKTAGIAANVLLPQKVGDATVALKSGPGAKLGTAAARDLMQQALRPGVADAETLSDVRNVVDSALEHGVKANPNGLTKLQSIIADYGQKINGVVNKADATGATVDPVSVASRIDQALPKYAAQVNPTKDLRTLQNAKEEFLGPYGYAPGGRGPLLPSEAQAMKQGTYQQTYVKAKDSSATQIEAEKILAQGLKEELESIAPELKGLNAKTGPALELEDVLARAVRRAGNQSIFGLNDVGAATTGALMGGGAAGTHGAIAGAVAGTLVKKIATNASVQSTLAIALHRAARSAGTRMTTATATTRAAAILNALQSRASGEETEQK